MKKNISLLILLNSLNPLSAFAVKVNQCPETLKITVTDIAVFNTSKVKSQVAEVDQDSAETVRASVEKLGTIDRSFTMDSSKTANSKCWYSDAQGDDILLYTSGSDKFRVRILLPTADGDAIGIYATIADYNPSCLNLDSNTVYLHYSTLGGDMPVGDVAEIAKAKIEINP